MRGPVRVSTRSEVLRLALQVLLGAADEVVRMRLDPGMAEAGVIGHVVEHQLQAALRKPLSDIGESSSAAECFRRRVAGDREARSADVVLGQVGQNLAKFLQPARMAARDGAARLTRLPDRQQPDPVKAEGGDTV